MSSLVDRVAGLYRVGHEGKAPELFGDERLASAELRPAAVLAALTDRPDEPGFLMLHRPSNMRSHPGQVAFPGGKIDPGETAVEAALREAWEELGIDQRDVQVIGPSDIYRSHSGFEITPVIAVVPPDIKINPNPAEVAQWFEAPAGFILDPANQRQLQAEWNGDARTYYEIPWGEHRIWGVTAAIIVNLSRRLRWHG